MSTSARADKRLTKSGEIRNQELNNIAFRKIRGIDYKAKLVLLAIINYRDENDNKCWPSESLLIEVTGLSENGVGRGLKELFDKGIVARVPGTGMCSRVSTYMVTVDLEGKHDQSKVPQRKTKPRKPADEQPSEDPWAGHGMNEKQAERVFKYWVTLFDLGPRYVFTDERKAAIKARAKEGATLLEAVLCIRGYWLASGVYVLAEEKTRGEIPAMNDFCLIFRNDTKMRQFYQDAEAERRKHGQSVSDDGKYLLNRDGERVNMNGERVVSK